jgi:hypothetical protein
MSRCTGPCRCGGKCGGHHVEPDQDILDAGQRALARAVLAREGRRVPDAEPAPPVAKAPAVNPDTTCGPDVTQQVKDVVAKTRKDFKGWDKKKQNDACWSLQNLMCAGAAWDVVELHNRKLWLPTYAPCATKPGKCEDSVMVDGGCSYGGSVNYVIFGVMCDLCDIWKMTMQDMIWVYKRSSANYGPSQRWADAGYHGWPAVPSPPGDRPVCTESCPTPYHGPAFRLHWYPASTTENVEEDCKEALDLHRDLRDSPPEPAPWGF